MYRWRLSVKLAALSFFLAACSGELPSVAPSVLTPRDETAPLTAATPSLQSVTVDERLFRNDPDRVTIFDVAFALAYTFPGIDTPQQALDFANGLLGESVTLADLEPEPTPELLAAFAAPAEGRPTITDVAVLLARTFPGVDTPATISEFVNGLLGAGTLPVDDILTVPGTPTSPEGENVIFYVNPSDGRIFSVTTTDGSFVTALGTKDSDGLVEAIQQIEVRNSASSPEPNLTITSPIGNPEQTIVSDTESTVIITDIGTDQQLIEFIGNGTDDYFRVLFDESEDSAVDASQLNNGLLPTGSSSRQIMPVSPPTRSGILQVISQSLSFEPFDLPDIQVSIMGSDRTGQQIPIATEQLRNGEFRYSFDFSRVPVELPEAVERFRENCQEIPTPSTRPRRAASNLDSLVSSRAAPIVIVITAASLARAAALLQRAVTVVVNTYNRACQIVSPVPGVNVFSEFTTLSGDVNFTATAVVPGSGVGGKGLPQSTAWQVREEDTQVGIQTISIPDPFASFNPEPSSGQTFDFGDVEIGATSEPQILTISEALGASPLTVESFLVDGEGFSVMPRGTVVSPGSSQDFSITCTPQSEGRREATLVVLVDDIERNRLNLTQEYTLICESEENIDLTGTWSVNETVITATPALPGFEDLFPGQVFNPTMTLQQEGATITGIFDYGSVSFSLSGYISKTESQEIFTFNAISTTPSCLGEGQGNYVIERSSEDNSISTMVGTTQFTDCFGTSTLSSEARR